MRFSLIPLSVMLALLAGSGCGSSENGVDAATVDASPFDVATADGARLDGGPADAGTLDGGSTDSGSTDGGPPGTVRWTYEHGLQVAFGPALTSSGLVVFQGRRSIRTAEGAPTLVALEPDGTFLWGATTEPGAVPAPAVIVAGSTLLAPATQMGRPLTGRVFRFEHDGTALTPWDTAGPITRLGAYSPVRDVAYIPSMALYAFRDGEPPWEFVLENEGTTGSSVGVAPDGTVYVGARGVANHNLYAINPDGTERWKRDMGRAMIHPLAVDREGRVYVMHGGAVLTVFEPDGEVHWTFAVPGRNTASGIALGEDGVVYFGTRNSAPPFEGDHLFAVRPDGSGGGEVVWNVSLEYAAPSTPALSAGGTLYASGSCGALHALSAATGEVRWRFDAPRDREELCPGAWSAATIGPDGTVYASVDGSLRPGVLYAFVGDGTGPSTVAAWPQLQRDATHGGSQE